MARIRKTIVIDAPVANVFDYLTQPENMPEIWPSMVEVSNVERTADGKHSFDWVYKMAGMRFHGHTDVQSLEPKKRVLAKNTKGIPSTFDWKYSDRNGKTELSLEVEYELPESLLSKLARPFIEKLNEHDAETLLNNLKARMELGAAASEQLAAE